MSAVLNSGLLVNQECQGKTGYQVPLVFLDSKVTKGSKVLKEHLVQRAPSGSLVFLGLQDLLVNLASCDGWGQRVKLGT